VKWLVARAQLRLSAPSMSRDRRHGQHGGSPMDPHLIDQGVTRFIQNARQKGMDYATIRALLLSAGWKDKDVARALSEGLDVPVPEPVRTSSPREAYVYLLIFTALYTMVISLIVLFFHYLDILFPDPAWEQWRFSEESARSTIRWALVAMIVSSVVFFVLERYLVGEIRRNPAAIRSAVRKWLGYLTLFAASVTLMFDLIWLLYYFLEGELSIRIVCKVTALCIIVGTVFWYYLLALHPAREAEGVFPRHLLRVCTSIAALIIGTALVWGFVIAGSPFTVRLQKFDDRRVEDLRAIRDAIQRMVIEREGGKAKLKRSLPAALEEVANYVRSEEFRSALNLYDPASKEPYAYTVLGKTRYKLCATFALPRDQKEDMFWNHPAGRHCFVFEAVEDEAKR
jgi:uncharacterized protein DUF5671